MLPSPRNGLVATMKQLIEFFPLILFFAVYYAWGIYPATAAAIIGSLAVVGWGWRRSRKLETVPLVTLVVAAVMGGLTLALQDDVFIKWKPTLVHWALAAALLATQWFGRATALEKILGGQLRLPRRIWRRVNLAWALFFAAAGALNLYVAFYYGAGLSEQTRTDHWVNFKVFGLTGLSLLFVIVQMALVARHLQEPKQ